MITEDQIEVCELKNIDITFIDYLGKAAAKYAKENHPGYKALLGDAGNGNMRLFLVPSPPNTTP